MADWKCNQCGIVNPPHAKFCAACGSPAPAPVQPAPYIGQPPPAPPQPAPYLGQPPVQNPYPGQMQGTAPQSNKALISVILGIVGLVACGPLTAVPGIFVAKQEMDAIKEGRSQPSNLGMAKAGFYISIGATIISVALCMIFGLFTLLNR